MVFAKSTGRPHQGCSYSNVLYFVKESGDTRTTAFLSPASLAVVQTLCLLRLGRCPAVLFSSPV